MPPRQPTGILAQQSTRYRVGTASGVIACLGSVALMRLMKIAEPRYKIAATIVSDFRPNQREADSRSPPLNDPKRFAPKALPRKPTRAKLETKMIPAKKTGVQRANVPMSARRVHDS